MNYDPFDFAPPTADEPDFASVRTRPSDAKLCQGDTITANEFGEPEDPDKFTISQLSSAEFDAGTYETTYIVEGILAAQQPCVIAGAMKSLKTTVAVDLAVAVALGRPFLGKFWVPVPLNVLLLSGESGLGALQSAGRRIAESHGFTLGQCDRLFWSTDLPKLGFNQHMEELQSAIVKNDIKLLILDPLYYSLPGGDAGNLMIVGGLLRSLFAVCEATGTTLVLVHHIRKSGIENKNAPAELSHISWSGVGEAARQWLLLSRRADYTPGTGEHNLWLSVGGSAGHSGLYAVDCYEGIGDARTWQATVREPNEVRGDEADAKTKAREAKQTEAITAAKKAFCRALAKFPNGETKSVIAGYMGRNNGLATIALAELLDEGSVVPCGVVKAGRKTPFDGYKLKTEATQ